MNRRITIREAYAKQFLRRKLFPKLKTKMKGKRFATIEEIKTHFSSVSRIGKNGLDKNIEAVKKIIFKNRQITIRAVADDVGISFGLCQAIFTVGLGMKCSAAKI